MYLDDVLIFSKSREEHMRHLTLVFDRLKYFGLILNKDKCIFDVEEIVFLGHKVNREGVAPLESKVTAIRNFPRPGNMKQLRRFLGMLNYYRRFIPAAAATLQPLNRMLSPRKYSRQTLRWNEEAEQAFSAIKTKLANATLLAFPVLGAETQVVVDASTSAIGGVLQQVIAVMLNHWPSFLRLLILLKLTILCSTVNCLPCTCHCDILGTFWRVALSLFLPITSH